MVNPIGILAVVILPIIIMLDSKKSIKRFCWEWTVISFLAMSTYMALLNDIVFPQWFKGRTFFAAWIRSAVTIFGPIAFWSIYKAVELPNLRVTVKGKRWQTIRTISALFLLFVIIVSYVVSFGGYKIETEAYEIDFGKLLLAGALGFIIGQIGLSLNSEKHEE